MEAALEKLPSLDEEAAFRLPHSDRDLLQFLEKRDKAQDGRVRGEVTPRTTRRSPVLCISVACWTTRIEASLRSAMLCRSILRLTSEEKTCCSKAECSTRRMCEARSVYEEAKRSKIGTI
ncbi:MAG: hypothetical protein OK454_03825 [Thaumarchaeota archaeon]|nr:hypothetical protein [Nitrososphaerota archaeon]